MLAGVGLVVLAAFRRRRFGVLLVGAGLALILIAALPGVAQALMAALEPPYPPRPAAACPRADAIVVPVGADYRSFRSCRGVACWVPSAGALEATELAVKEWLGYGIQVTGAGGHTQ